MNRYFICICNPRLHSCLSKNIFDINSYKSKIKKRSATKKLRNGLESLRDAKINKKLETLKTKPGFLSTGRAVYREREKREREIEKERKKEKERERERKRGEEEREREREEERGRERERETERERERQTER